ncbi:ATP-dependent nuclease [Staphylococcus xylosus]|uniref:ATP-dependent nuclease n=1 Tax=Staphylococcus xylosus TaxID=1288 RepID=UPI003F9CC3BC
MKLDEVYIENFRSIIEMNIKMSNYTVVLGKNNVGKTNVMKAIIRGWNILDEAFSSNVSRFKSSKSETKQIRIRRYSKIMEEMEKDFPIVDSEDINDYCNVIIGFYFNINEEELLEIKSKLNNNSKLNGRIYIEINYDNEGNHFVKVKINEYGGFLRSITSINFVIEFVKTKFDIDYIQSIRTEDTATDIVQEAVKERLRDLTNSDEYNKAVKLINNLQEKEIEKISEQIEPDLKRYLNNIDSVEVVLLKDNIRSMVNFGLYKNIDIKINDGRLTSLKSKGDGIKSLIALSILQTSESSNRLLMIDEPESHLHSGAIRELKNKILNDTSNHQILICSHHQIFVDRNKVNNNKIISDGKLVGKIDIRRIRKELEVSLSENLLSAEVVLLVEGETDKAILEMYIREKRKDLLDLLNKGTFIIDVIRGVSKLNQKISFYESGLCNVLALLDNDEAVKREVQSVVISQANLFLIPKFEKKESEIEDIFEKNFIYNIVDQEFGLNNSTEKIIKQEKKLTDNLKLFLQKYGKIFDKEEKEQFKWNVVSHLKKEDVLPIQKHYCEFMESVCDRSMEVYKNKSHK